MSTPSKSEVGDDPELLELQSSFSEQQAKITALREIIRQTEVVNDMKNATAQEKVKNIAQRLTHFKTKVTTSRLNRANSANTSLLAPITEPNVKNPGERADGATTSFQRGRSESSPMEMCSLLRQQIEKNRLKMAERESCKREIEEKVIEIKHKLEMTQQTLEKSTEHDRRRSYIDGLDTLAADDVGPHVFDPSIRQGPAINQSISIVDDSPWMNSTAYGSREEGDASFHKDHTQNTTSSSIPNAVATQTKNDELLESELKALKECLQEKNSIIDGQLLAVCHLVNNVTGFDCAWSEDTHRDISLVKELHRLQVDLLQKAHKLTIDEAENRLLESYGYDPVERIEEKSSHIQECQNLPVDWSQEIANEEGVDLRNALDKIASLEHTIAAQDQELEKMNQQMADLRQSLEEKTIELNVMTANVSVLQEKLKSSGPKPLFPRSADEELETEATKLRQQLDESNKTMIKCKLRIKQLQKQVDTFKKISNVHEEVARLTEELNAVSAAGGDGARKSSRGEAFVGEGTLAPEVQKRIETLEQTCQNQATAMQLLEEQKNDLSEDLCRTRNELQLLASERAVVGPEGAGDSGEIATQMLSIELEEKLEKCLADKTELTKVLHTWEAEKAELQQRLKQAMEENAELLGRIEKLSIEKVSSAESIEILENLTAHEKQEMEKSEKRALGQPDDTDGGVEVAAERDESKENLNESLLKLMEESKELMDKVEMFTDERREVLEKLDAISIENQAYISELDRLKEINAHLCSYSMELESTKSSLEEKLQAIHVEKESILHELDTARTSSGKVVVVEECTPSVSFQSAAAPSGSAATCTDEAYEQALVALENELANYHKNKDKQKKLQVSKKLASNAKNVITASRQLVSEHNACLLERSKLCEQIATLSQQRQTQPEKEEESAADRVERYQLAELKRELEVASEKSSDDEPELLKVELNSRNEEIVALKRIMEAQAKAKSTEILHLQQQLHEAREQSHLLQQRADKAEQLGHRYEALCDETVANQDKIAQLSVELQRANDSSQQKGETIAALERRIGELMEELQAATTRADEHPVKAELEQTNQELLDKLKKFAANLKRKNTQCKELEEENKQLVEANRRLEENQPEPESDTALREENEQLAQKLHHLNNQLHRLLEQKYQLEAECEAGRDERAVLDSQLAAAQEERTALDNRVRELEQELEQLRVELDAGRKEVASKNAKIEKCKAIIKEKIKETHRLQEHERRTTYLEDELRMTQSKLEDFHNQTLLLGRLKNEKEELNAAVKAEHEQRRRLQQLLDKSEQELAGAYEKERALSDLLAQVDAWVRRFGDRWLPGGEPAPPHDTISHLSEWCTVLVETERAIERTLAQKTQELAGVDRRLQDAEQSARKLHAEMDETRGQLSNMQQTSGEQQQTIAKLTEELEQAQAELQRMMSSNSQMAQLQSDIDGLHSRLQEAEAVRNALQNSLATVQQESAQLRETLAQEKTTVDELRVANESLADELQLLRRQTTEVDRSHQELRVEYEQLREEALARESKLNDELRRRDAEMDAMREDYDEQLGSNSQAKEQLNVELRRKDHELEVLRRDYEEKLLEEVQTKEQLQDALERMTREVESLRHNYEEKLLEEAQTKVQLQDALQRMTQEVEGFQQRLLEEAQTKEQLQNALATMSQEVESGHRQFEQQQVELTQTKNQLSEVLTQKEQELACLRKSYDEQHTQKTQTEQQIDSVIRQKDEELEALCQGYENQLANGRQTKEQLEQTLAQKDRELEEQLLATTQLREQLNEALRRKDEELETLRQRLAKEQVEEMQHANLEAVRLNYEAQLADVKHSKEQLNEALRRKDEELETLRQRLAKEQVEEMQQANLEAVRQDYEAQLADVKHSKEQLNEALRRKDEQLETLRQRLEEQMANPAALTKDQLDELQDAELEAVRQDYEAQLADVRHSKEQLNEALQRKDKELESLRKTYKECCEQQDVLGRNHFQELNALQQKLLESVGERVALQQTVDGMSAESDRLRTRIASLERQTNENLTNTSILSSLNEALNEELDQLQERMQAGTGDGEASCALEHMLRQKNETIEQLKAQQQLMQQEITDLKVKAGKLLRKLKETRARCDVLEEAATTTTTTTTMSAASDGWDVEPASTATLPEDEARLSAAEAERAKLQTEKDALLAKLDTLETACEKLTELKEHQDRQIEALRNASQEQEVLRDRLQHTTAALQTRESELMHLNAQLEQLSGVAEQAEQLKRQLFELEQRATVSSAATTTAAPTTEIVETRLAELEHRNRLLEDEKSEMGRELEALNQQILHDLQFEDRLHKATLELDAKNVELQMLRATLEQMQMSAPATEQVPVATTTAQEQQIATLEARVLELEQQKAFYEQQLDAAPIEALDYERAVEQPAEVAPADAKVREVLERQELEIVTLKEQLAVRSAEYARLAAHVDPTRLLALINSGGVSPPTSGQQQQQSADSRDSRAELELALYMIYQRDMRCDELELELRNLLEERDALQLRLSNALRMHEDFRLKCATVPTSGDATEYGTSGECSIESSPERPATASADDPRPMSSMSTAADSPDLSSKLSELHSISYSKEKRWQEEREDRNRQLTLIQRDLANMPLEAAAKIAGTDVVADADTSSQQSASSVLLNWILGKK